MCKLKVHGPIYLTPWTSLWTSRALRSLKYGVARKRHRATPSRSNSWSVGSLNYVEGASERHQWWRRRPRSRLGLEAVGEGRRRRGALGVEGFWEEAVGDWRWMVVRRGGEVAEAPPRPWVVSGRGRRGETARETRRRDRPKDEHGRRSRLWLG
jgi:hypothetical protein